MLASLSCCRRNPLNNLDHASLYQTLYESVSTTFEIPNLDAVSFEKLLEMTRAQYLFNGNFEQMLENLTICDRELNRSLISAKPASDHFRTLRQVVDTVLEAFSFFSLGKTPGSTYDASQTISVYAQVLAAPFIIVTTANALLGNAVSAVLVTACIISTVAIGIFLYVRYLMPFPESVCEFRDYIALARAGKIPPIVQRIEVLKGIISLLKAGMNVLIVGEPGTGKNAIVQELARMIAFGEVPELFHQYFLGGIASHLKPDQYALDGGKKWKSFINRLLPYLPQTIIALDELHQAMESPALWSALMDASGETVTGLPCAFIGMTTPAGLAAMQDKKDGSLRRWRIVNLDQTSKEKTVAILKELAKREFPHIAIPDPRVFDEIVETSSGTDQTAQPDAAIKQLRIHLSKASQNIDSRCREAYEKAKSEHHANVVKYVEGDRKLNIAESERELKRREVDFQSETELVAKLAKARTRLHQQENRVMHLARAIKMNNRNDGIRKEVLVSETIFQPALKAIIRELEMKLKGEGEGDIPLSLGYSHLQKV